MFTQYSCISKGEKVENYFFLIYGSKKLRGLFLSEPCGLKNDLYSKKNILPNLFLHYLKFIKFQISCSHTTKMRVKTLKIMTPPPFTKRVKR